jgi:hypothetical protein
MRAIGVLLIFGGLVYAIPTAYIGYVGVALPGFLVAVGGVFVLVRGNRDARRVTAERESLGIPSGGGVNGPVLVAVIVVIGLFVLILTGATTVALILIIIIVILAIGGALVRAYRGSS